MNRDQALKIVWRHMHRDYKGTTDGAKTVMIWRNGTCLVRLSDLTDDEIRNHLPRDQRDGFKKENA